MRDLTTLFVVGLTLIAMVMYPLQQEPQTLEAYPAPTYEPLPTLTPEPPTATPLPAVIKPYRLTPSFSFWWVSPMTAVELFEARNTSYPIYPSCSTELNRCLVGAVGECRVVYWQGEIIEDMNCPVGASLTDEAVFLPLVRLAVGDLNEVDDQVADR